MTVNTIDCGDLRVVFDWRGDRYGHTVERWIESQWQPLLESVEGAPDDEWPPSPALQSLQIERRASGPVALLVGMAGKSHWSASVSITADGQGFLFDVAARITSRRKDLGSAYAWKAPFDFISCASRIRGSVPGLVTIELLTPDLPGSAQLLFGDEVWWLSGPMRRGPLPCTVQWQYQVYPEPQLPLQTEEASD
jgi:hypothetical protein